jgi:hypothetical protein
MNLSTRTALMGLWLLLATSSLTAQIGFSLPELSDLQPESTVDMPVTVENFSGIASAQFALQWDPTVLQFDTVLLSTLQALDTTDFGLTQTNLGILRFAWTASSLGTGASLNDGANLFTLRFTVIGASGMNSGVDFVELPPVTYFEVATAQGTLYGMNDANLANGAACINCTVSTHDISNNTELRIVPNPVADRAELRLTLADAGAVQLTVRDVAGRFVAATATAELPAGLHAIELPLAGVQTKGLYFLTVRTAKTALVRPFLLD